MKKKSGVKDGGAIFAAYINRFFYLTIANFFKVFKNLNNYYDFETEKIQKIQLEEEGKPNV